MTPMIEQAATPENDERIGHSTPLPWMTNWRNRCGTSAAAFVLTVLLAVGGLFASSAPTSAQHPGLLPHVKSAPSEPVEPQAVVTGVHHFQKQVDMTCAGAGCFGGLRVAPNRRLIADFVSCLVSSGVASNLDVGKFSIRTPSLDFVLGILLGSVRSDTDRRLHTINQAMNVRLPFNRVGHILLNMDTNTSRSAFCAVTGKLETLQ